MRSLAWFSFGAILHLTLSLFIPNEVPRTDANGTAIDVHDGRIVQWVPGGDYYWYGMGYGGCLIDTTGSPCAGVFGTVQSAPCGFQLNHSINIFTSSDLLNWTFRGEALPQVQNINGVNVSRPMGIYYRPKVIYHPTRNKYILWVNFLPATSLSATAVTLFPTATYVVAESDSPTGPFQVVTNHTDNQNSGPGDFDILVDGNNAYIAYTAFGNDHQIFIEQLNSNFTNVAQPVKYVGPIGPSPVEAPAFFKYGSYYYVMFGATCCFCYAGSGVHVYYSTSPLGPWTDSGVDIGLSSGPSVASRVRAQQAGVFAYASPNGTVLIWTGDQWGLSSDGTKGHVFQYWVPMMWSNSSGTVPLPEKLQVVTGFNTDAPFNLQPYLTGFCDKTEAGFLNQVLAQLGACTSTACYQAVLGSITPDCAQCISAMKDPTMILEKCTPPDYQTQTTGTACTAAEATATLQFLASCPVLTQCSDQAAALLGSLSGTCGTCLIAASTGSGLDLTKVMACFPADFVVGSSPPSSAVSPMSSVSSGVDVAVSVAMAYLSSKYGQKKFDVSGIASLGAADLVTLVAAIVETETVLAIGAVFMYILTASTTAITIAQEAQQSITTSVVSWGDASVSRAVCTSYTPTASGFSQMGIQQAVNRVYYFLFAVDRLSSDGHLKNNLTFTFRIKIPTLREGLALVVRTYNASFTSGVDITREGGMVRYIGGSWWEITTHHTSALSGETTNSSSSSTEESSGSSDGLLGLLALLAFIPLCAAAGYYVYWSQRRQPPPVRYFEPAAQPYPTPTVVSYGPPFSMPFNSTPSYEMHMSYSMPQFGSYPSFPPTDVYSSLATAPLADPYPSMVTAPVIDVHPSFARPPPADGYPASATAPPTTDGYSAFNTMKLMTDVNPGSDAITTTLPSF